MDKEYKIEVSLTPNYQDNKFKPYHWTLFIYDGNDWCNEGFGWTENPELAWEEAYNFYINFKMNK